MNRHDAIAAEREPEPLLGVERDALLEPFREPHWAYWSTVETAELWALVALVFRAEPYWTSRLVEFDYRDGRPGWQRDRFVRLPRLLRLRDDPAFQQQLDAAISWVHLRELERLDSVGGDPARAVVAVISFVEVASARGWQVPQELRHERGQQGSPTEARFQKDRQPESPAGVDAPLKRTLKDRRVDAIAAAIAENNWPLKPVPYGCVKELWRQLESDQSELFRPGCDFKNSVFYTAWKVGVAKGRFSTKDPA